MAQHRRLTPETFLAVAEMIAAHLRIKEADRWSPHICRLKFHSFTSEFPEVTEAQFMWASEQWIQALGPGFTRYPTWRELMAPLYRNENGMANRSWGFKDGLPAFLAPTAEQLAALPSSPQSIAGCPDPENGAAYVPFHTTDHPLLPPASAEAQGLTEEQWREYLNSLSDGATDQQGGAAADPREGTGDGEVERVPVQRPRARANPSKQGLSRATPAVQ